MTTTRDLLKMHTADQVGRFLSDDGGLLGLVGAAHDPEATDEQAESAALAFLDDWSGHPNYRKCARYGLILWAMRHRDETAHRMQAFNTHVQKLGYANTRDWYCNYTGYRESAAA